MTYSELIKIILTSTVVATIVSSVTSYILSLHLAKVGFKNEYYKAIIAKRLTAYQYIEAQIAILKNIVLDEDKKSYHTIFAYGEEEFVEYQQNIHLAISNGIWIDQNTMTELENLNDLFFSLTNHVHNKPKNEMISIGKKYYKEISDKRFSLENSVKRGLFELYDVKKIFKTKKTNTAREVKVR